MALTKLLIGQILVLFAIVGAGHLVRDRMVCL